MPHRGKVDRFTRKLAAPATGISGKGYTANRRMIWYNEDSAGPVCPKLAGYLRPISGDRDRLF